MQSPGLGVVFVAVAVLGAVFVAAAVLGAVLVAAAVLGAVSVAEAVLGAMSVAAAVLGSVSDTAEDPPTNITWSSREMSPHIVEHSPLVKPNPEPIP